MDRLDLHEERIEKLEAKDVDRLQAQIVEAQEARRSRFSLAQKILVAIVTSVVGATVAWWARMKTGR